MFTPNLNKGFVVTIAIRDLAAPGSSGDVKFLLKLFSAADGLHVGEQGRSKILKQD